MQTNEKNEIIYNVTVKVTGRIATEWVQWMIEQHIPEVIGTNCFYKYQLVKLMEQDDSEGPTYAVQYYARSSKDYERYIGFFAPALRQKTIDKWGDQFIAFRSLMQVIQ